MRTLTFVILIGLLTAPTAKAVESKLDERELLMSYVVYPHVELYVQFIQDVYQDLGYSVKMIATPATRGLLLLSEGEVDADVVRLKSTAATFPNILLVEPELKIGKLALLCRKEVTCTESVLNDPSVVILSRKAFDFYFQDYHYSAQIERTVNDGIEMLRAKRANYAFVVLDGQLELLPDFNVLNIQDISVVHVIHKKHAKLLPLIQQKIAEKLEDFHHRFDPH
ncbi:MAG: hypothetical protein GW763_16110 [Paraglaciecola sp.]|nr:hypothetical protein [Paraglaciecola sp.]NCT49477.1 hypothetical protein [Paraglaciecola sp.]